MAVADLYNLESYSELVRQAGFTVASVEDLTADWSFILKQRLAMYRKLRKEAQQRRHLPVTMRFMKVTSVLSNWYTTPYLAVPDSPVKSQDEAVALGARVQR